MGQVTHAISSATGINPGGDLGSALNSDSVDIGGAYLNKYTGGTANPFESGGNINKLIKGPDKPDAPPPDPNLAKIHQQQLSNASNFRANTGNMENQMYSQLQQQGQGQLNQNLSGIRSMNSRRGLLYGGVNAGQEQGARGQMAQSLAAGRSNINAGVQGAADTLDQQAVQTGLGIQKNTQAIQNDIYAQALGSMQTQNAMFSGAMGLLGGGAAKGMMGSGAGAMMA